MHEAKSLEEAGFTEQDIAKSRPALNAVNVETIEVWHAMGGWFPERLPVLMTMMDLAHIDGLFDRLLIVRDEVARDRNV